jgi:hypothetical protein
MLLAVFQVVSLNAFGSISGDFPEWRKRPGWNIPVKPMLKLVKSHNTPPKIL